MHVTFGARRGRPLTVARSSDVNLPAAGRGLWWGGVRPCSPLTWLLSPSRDPGPRSVPAPSSCSRKTPASPREGSGGPGGGGLATWCSSPLPPCRGLRGTEKRGRGAHAEQQDGLGREETPAGQERPGTPQALLWLLELGSDSPTGPRSPSRSRNTGLHSREKGKS